MPDPKEDGLYLLALGILTCVLMGFVFEHFSSLGMPRRFSLPLPAVSHRRVLFVGLCEFREIKVRWGNLI